RAPRESTTECAAPPRSEQAGASTGVEIPLAPADFEYAVAPPTPQIGCLAAQRHPLATARAHGVAPAHFTRQARRALRFLHDRPPRRPCVDDLQVLAWQQHRLLVDVDDGLERGDAHHPIPRAAAQRAAVISPESGPVLL